MTEISRKAGPFFCYGNAKPSGDCYVDPMEKYMLDKRPLTQKTCTDELLTFHEIRKLNEAFIPILQC